MVALKTTLRFAAEDCDDFFGVDILERRDSEIEKLR
jgi:hypothetical protein